MKTITINYPGGSLLDIRKKYGMFYNQSWYDKQPFASKKIPKGKWTVSLEPVPNSTSKSWDAQLVFLDKGKVVPPAAVLAYALIQHHKETGEHELQNIYLRCSDIYSDAYRVSVGVFSKSVNVSYYWDSCRHSYLGLAAAWKEPRTLEPSVLPRTEALKLVSEMEKILEKFKSVIEKI